MEGRFFKKRPLLHPSIEVGVSDGDMSQLCLSGKTDVGIDPIGFLLARGRERDVCHHYIRADVRETPIQSDRFSEVICIDVLHHVPDGKKAIREIYRILKPDGLFTFTTVSNYSVMRTFKGLWSYLIGDKNRMCRIARKIPLFNCRSLEEWKTLLEKEGFQVIEGSYFCHTRHWFMFLAAYYLMHLFKAPVMEFYNRIDTSWAGRIWKKLLLFISFSYALNERRRGSLNRGHNVYLRCKKMPVPVYSHATAGKGADK
jgi:SAM-dependent methyltransferase